MKQIQILIYFCASQEKPSEFITSCKSKVNILTFRDTGLIWASFHQKVDGKKPARDICCDSAHKVLWAARSVLGIKARSHGTTQKMDCLGLNESVHTVHFYLCLVCAMLHMIGYHTHSVRLRLRFYESLQLVSPRAQVFSCILLYFLPIANVVCFCQN